MKVPLGFNKLSSIRKVEYLLRKKNIEEECEYSLSISTYVSFIGFITLVLLILAVGDKKDLIVQILPSIGIACKAFCLIFIIVLLVSIYYDAKYKKLEKKLDLEFFKIDIKAK